VLAYPSRTSRMSTHARSEAAEGGGVLKQLLAVAGVRVENYQPGVARRLGIGPYATRGGCDVVARA
jgi:crotonobetainyl-CoA:carnitine CoA-transferase CaiB-like acyl-CoA transferase